LPASCRSSALPDDIVVHRGTSWRRDPASPIVAEAAAHSPRARDEARFSFATPAERPRRHTASHLLAGGGHVAGTEAIGDREDTARRKIGGQVESQGVGGTVRLFPCFEVANRDERPHRVPRAV